MTDEFSGRTRRRELAALLQHIESTVERGQPGRLEDDWRKCPPRDRRIDEHLRALLDKADIGGGRVLEIGGRHHPRARIFDADSYVYDNMDIVADIASITADITACPEIPGASFDVIVSVDVFEHITRPWLAAGEIVRLLAPGGLVYTSTLFSWRYHPCPVDFWRFSPDALEFLFADLDPLDSGFDMTERRRDFRKRSVADPTALDALGGWRENVRVFHAAVKPSVTA